MGTSLLVATTNPGKLREIAGILNGLPVTLTTLADLPDIAPPEETGSSFAENARDKALHYARASGLPTIAEDSGFEVAALKGTPGIFSARFLRPDATYEERFAEIYRRLREQGLHRSPARFVCALAFATPSGVQFETTGVVEGMTAARAAGGEGFGYDPIFFYPPYGRTFGEVSAAEKAAVSHRSQAFRAFRRFLETHFGPL